MIGQAEENGKENPVKELHGSNRDRQGKRECVNMGAQKKATEKPCLEKSKKKKKWNPWGRTNKAR